MALVKCKECGNEISSEAIACPHCGIPIKTAPVKKSSVFGIVVKVIISIIIIFIAVVGLVCSGGYWFGSKVVENTTKRFEEAKSEETKIQIKNLESALKLFKLDNGFYPETQQGLIALIQMPTVGRETCCYARDAYLEGYQVPLDGWKNEFIYVGPDQTGDGIYEIISIGADGLRDTKDDISSRTID